MNSSTVRQILRLLIGTIGIAASCLACTVWQHQWRVLGEDHQERFDPTMLQVLRSMMPPEKGKPETIFLTGAEIASSGDNALETGLALVRLPPERSFPNPEELRAVAATTPCLLVEPLHTLTTQRWLVDDSLPAASLVRWEHLSRSSLRWVCLASDGSSLGIDETPLITGFILTVSAWPWLNPVVRLERYLGPATPVASISWMAALLPQNGSGTDFVEAQEIFTPK